MIREEITEKLISVLQRYPVKRAVLFGSYARNDYNADSDVDIVVEFKTESPGLMFFSLQGDLSDSIGRPVDLIWEAGLCHMEEGIRLSISKDKVVLYEADIK